MADRDAGSRGEEDEPRDPEGREAGEHHEPGPPAAAAPVDPMPPLKPFTAPSGAPGTPRPGGAGPIVYGPVPGPAGPGPVPGPAGFPGARPLGSASGAFGAAPAFGPAQAASGPAYGPAATRMYGQPPFDAGPALGGHAYGPGGTGWTAPGWGTAAGGAGARPGNGARSAASRFGAFARGRGGQLIVAGLIGAVIGGGTVGVGTALWNRDGGYGATLDNGYQDGPWNRPYGGGQRLKDLQDQLSQLCRPTEGGFRCELPRSGGSR
ncbi:hypothetical protein [Microtetraspora niveoalba]|uniref:hypothetical protein n=1 Tax=Microtetraspora niveoalba TaxID=46175 RepID=UPI000831AB09|nr:hypothetical protein [Microtetraspora niveoalba]